MLHARLGQRRAGEQREARTRATGRELQVVAIAPRAHDAAGPGAMPVDVEQPADPEDEGVVVRRQAMRPLRARGELDVDQRHRGRQRQRRDVPAGRAEHHARLAAGQRCTRHRLGAQVQGLGRHLAQAVGQVDPDLEAARQRPLLLGLLLVQHAAARHRDVQRPRRDAVAGAQRVLVDEAHRALRNDVGRDHEARVRMRRKGRSAHVVERDGDEGIEVGLRRRRVQVAGDEPRTVALRGQRVDGKDAAQGVHGMAS